MTLSRQPQHTDMHLPPSLSRILPGDFATNPPVMGLLAANIVTIVLAILGNWDLASILFIYWVQSIIIGIFAVVRLLSADTAALAADIGTSQAEHGGSRSVSEGYVRFYKVALAGFFALHYGLFHWGYFSFIVESGLFGPVNFADRGIWAASGLFFFNRFYSFFYHRRNERRGGTFVTQEFIQPYNRIIPMHMTIIFGSIVMIVFEALGILTLLPVLVLFLALKTWMDIRMHLQKHYAQTHPDEPVQYIGF